MGLYGEVKEIERLKIPRGEVKPPDQERKKRKVLREEVL